MAKKLAKKKTKKVVKIVTKKKAKKSSKKTVKVLTEPSEVKFDYIKSNYFRVIRVDGAHGGMGTNINSIQMALFSERRAIPKTEIYPVVDGKLGKPSKKISRDAIIREVEVEAIIDLETAKAIKNLLDENIKNIENIKSQIEKK